MALDAREAPKGEWLGYPTLRLEDIEHESFKVAKQFAEFLVKNRQGRVYLLMDNDLYQRFLAVVRKKSGDISASNVERAALDAIRIWIEKVESK